MPFCTIAQRDSLPAFKHEISIRTDNDSYMLHGDDGYYTNGLFFNFIWAGKSRPAGKKVHDIEIGQFMYNAKNGDYSLASEIDRPVAALLYAQYKQTWFNAKGSVLEWSIMGGVMGPPAEGEQLQDLIHNIIGAYGPSEWKYQLNTSVGTNIGLRWSPNVLSNIDQQSIVALKPILQANAGSFFTNADLGFIFQLGAFEKNSESVLWNARVTNLPAPTRRHHESYFYFYPQIGYQAYNATIQGKLFGSNKGGIVGETAPFFFRQQLGWQYAQSRVSLGLSVIYETREAKEQRAPQWYGSMKLGYRFGKK